MANANIKAVITAEDRASKTISGVGASFGKMTAAMAAGQIVARGVERAFDILQNTVKSSVVAAFDQVRSVENATFALKAYEKNGDKVNKVLKELVAYARSDMGTLFQREDLFAAAQTLKLYGTATEDLTKRVKILSKGVALGKTSFQELSNIIGRAAAKGRLDAVDFDMLIERGIGLDKSMRGASITAEELFKALDKALPDELLKGRANTIDGLMVKLKSSLRDVGSAILGVNTETSTFIKGGLGDQFLGWVKTFTAALKSPEFKAGLQAVVDWLSKNLPIAITWAKDVGFPALINAIKTIWPILKTLIEIGGKVVEFFSKHTNALKILIGVIVAWKTAMLITDTVNAFTNGINTIIGKTNGLNNKLSKFQGWTLFATSAVTAFVLIKGEMDSLRSRTESNMDKIMNKSDKAVDKMKSLNKKWKAGEISDAEYQRGLARINKATSKAVQDANAELDNLGNTWQGQFTGRMRMWATNAFKSLPGMRFKASGTDFFTPRYASGTNSARGGMALVGERGPELVSLPRGSKVYRNDETQKMMGGNTTINISVNAGAYMGSQIDARVYARKILEALSEVAGMKGVTLTEMIART